MTKEVELIEDVTEDEHWQDVRERAAIAVMLGLLVDPSRIGSPDDYAKTAIYWADALVKQLKMKE